MEGYMSNYKVYCDSCDAEFEVSISTVPKHCASCGTELDETCVSEETGNFSDEDWDKLIEDIDEWDEK
jgi:rRNA maturation endonuclease Nob1